MNCTDKLFFIRVLLNFPESALSGLHETRQCYFAIVMKIIEKYQLSAL